MRRVLSRPGYECEIAIISNGDFGIGGDYGHGALGGGSTPSSAGLTAMSPSPRVSTALLDRGTRIAVIVWWVDTRQERDIHTERLGRELAGLSDSLTESFWVGLCQRCEDT